MPLEIDDNWGFSGPSSAYNTVEAILTSATAQTTHPYENAASVGLPGSLQLRVNHIVEYLNEHYFADLTLVGMQWSISASFTQLIEWLKLHPPFDGYVWPYAQLGKERRMKRDAEDPLAASCADKLPAVPSIFSDDSRW